MSNCQLCLQLPLVQKKVKYRHEILPPLGIELKSIFIAIAHVTSTEQRNAVCIHSEVL